ncbi:MAG: PKD domain-containing protein, partial [Bacteroidota bacterium]
YSSSGTFDVTLRLADSDGDVSYHTEQVVVTTNTAPSVSIGVNDSRCILNSNTFVANPTSGLSYSWDFNGEGSSSSSVQTFQFPTTGEKRVVLTVSDGTCTNQAVEVFDIYPQPPDPVFLFDEAQYCASVDLEVNNLTNDAAFSGNLDYEWIVQTDSSLVFEGADPAINVPSVGTFTVTAQSSVPGCESNITTGSLTIEPSPETDFSFTPTCDGDVTTFTNLTTGSVSQQWNFGNNFTSTQFAPEHFYDSAATYVVSLTAVNDLGCAKTVTDSITVGSLPEPGFQIVQGCEGAVALEDTSTVVGADIAEWSWSIENELFSNDQNPVQEVSDPGVYLVRQRVTSSQGCEAELLRQITIFDAAEVAFETITACNGSPFTFTDVSTTLDNNPIVDRRWSVNGTLYDEETIQHTFPAPGSYQATLILTNQNLCTATRTETVIVPDIPTLDFPTAAGCQNEFLTINDESIVGNDTIISRSWFLNGQVIGSGSTLLHRFEDDGVNEVTLSVTTQQGCLYEHTEEISVFPAATADFEATTTFGVEGTAIGFTNSSSLASSFVWALDGDSLSNAQDFNFRFDESGDFDIALVATSDFGCMDTLHQDIRIRRPEVDLVIREMLLQEEDPQFSSIIVSLENRSNLPVGDLDFTITVDDQLPTRDRVQEIVEIGETRVFQLSTNVPNRARYICLAVDSDYDVADNAPGDNEVCINIEPTVIFEEPRPNPVTDETVVRTVLPENGSVILSLVSVSGKLEKRESYPDLTAGLQAFTIQMQDLDAGLYVLRIEYNGQTDTKRILKR